LLGQRAQLLAVASHLRPAEQARAWALVGESDAYNAWLVAWGPESRLVAHDHGGSGAALHVLRGSLVEWYRDPDDRAAWNVRELGPGRTITVPVGRVHEVQTLGYEAALSLHVYAPRLETMNAFESITALAAR
jgi:hypothetical protein